MNNGGCTRMTANVSGWATYVILEGKKTTCFRLPYKTITIWSLPVFLSNSIFQNYMGTNMAFVLTSLAGCLAASRAELCHESSRQVLLPRRIFSAQEGYYSHKQPYTKISSQLEAGRKCVSQPQRTIVAFLILEALLCEWASHPSFHLSESHSKARIHNSFQLDAVWKPE